MIYTVHIVKHGSMSGYLIQCGSNKNRPTLIVSLHTNLIILGEHRALWGECKQAIHCSIDLAQDLAGYCTVFSQARR